MKTYYNIQDKDLEAQYSMDKKTRWSKVEKTLLSDQELTRDVITDIAKEAKFYLGLYILHNQNLYNRNF